MYQEIKGDLLNLFDKGMFDAIGHGANCFCKMKSGIAGQISKKFPGATEADIRTKPGDKGKFGVFSYWDHSNGSRLYNLYSQYNYGREEGHLYLDYKALNMSLRNMKANLWTRLCPIDPNNKMHRIHLKKPMEIGFPQIGCGLAQGDWERVKKIIQNVFKYHDITIVIYETNTNKKPQSKNLWDGNYTI